ncbi:hypothetical protein [Kitasatospora sp. NPDC096204]|uniref:hypothetical protein n=1 Tax=Kitasatospora sp. NPDC096204 TaxID=3364094 RepID=UPI0038051A7D
MTAWTTFLDTEGRVNWRNGDQVIVGRVKALCTDTPYWNPEGYPRHDWKLRDDGAPLWTCKPCGHATVGRPICPDAEHRFPPGADLCQNCNINFLDLYRPEEARPELPTRIE